MLCWARRHGGRPGTCCWGSPLCFLLLAVALVFLFALVNGISVGVSDSNPISSAFVVAVVLMALLGLEDPGVGLMAGTVLLVVDQRGLRHAAGPLHRLAPGHAIACCSSATRCWASWWARCWPWCSRSLFMAAYPVLLQDQTVMKADQQPAEWSSAMTYKFVGVLRSLTDDKPYQRTAIVRGHRDRASIEALRKRAAQAQLAERWRPAPLRRSTRCCCLRPYALSFGGFVNLPTSLWFGAGSVRGQPARSARAATDGASDLPTDMSGTSLFGGGLIAGDALRRARAGRRRAAGSAAPINPAAAPCRPRGSRRSTGRRRRGDHATLPLAIRDQHVAAAHRGRQRAAAGRLQHRLAAAGLDLLRQRRGVDAARHHVVGQHAGRACPCSRASAACPRCRPAARRTPRWSARTR